MSIAPRVEIDGFNFVQAVDTATHEIETGFFEVDGVRYDVDFIRSKRARGGSFLPAAVHLDGKKVWSFQAEKFQGLAFMAVVGGLPVICLCRNHGVEDIRPLPDLGKIQSLVVAGEKRTIHVRPILEIVRLKAEAAKQLGDHPVFTTEENAAVASHNKEVAAKTEAMAAEKKATEAAEREKREAKRRERVQEIQLRRVPFVYYEDGQRVRRTATTVVVGDEWMMFPDNTFVLLVSSYDDESHECGGVLETFHVSKARGGRPGKRGVKPVSDSPSGVEKLGPAGAKPVMPEAKEMISVKIDGESRQVIVFGNMDEIRAARVAGLNNGAYAGHYRDDGVLVVYRSFKEEMKTVGYFRRVSPAS